MRLHHDAVIGQSSHGVRKLENRKCVIALSDTDGNRVSLRPALLKPSLFPFSGRENASSLAD